MLEENKLSLCMPVAHVRLRAAPGAAGKHKHPHQPKKGSLWPPEDPSA